MRFNLVFENSGDSIEFNTVANQDLIAYFINRSNHESHDFSDDSVVYRTLDKFLQEINWSVSKTNEVLFDLYGQNFPQYNDLLDYLDQTNLNRQHAIWVKSQSHIIDIDQLKSSSDFNKSKIGYRLHELYPDEIRKIRLAEAMTKLGYIFPYEEVNMTVHRLESFFYRPIEYKANVKWQVFDNPYLDDTISNNDQVNFSFGYTYVGRQYYNKWQHFDTNLEFDDHYNYETLEWAFQINLGRPQTIPYSREFLEWCSAQNARPITTQIPIANIVDLERNLHYYRKMIYKNSRDGNRVKLLLC